MSRLTTSERNLLAWTERVLDLDLRDVLGAMADREFAATRVTEIGRLANEIRDDLLGAAEVAS